LKTGETVENLEAILARVGREKKQVGDLIGWETEFLPGLISIYVTADAVGLFARIGGPAELIEALNTLRKTQNSDGGWGVCNGDRQSKTRATSYVLRAYANCLDTPTARRYVETASYVAGIEWLNRAQNDSDGGWGNLAETYPSNVSATGIALDALLSTKLVCGKQDSIVLPVRDSVIKAGLSRLLDFSSDGKWRGPVEEFNIQFGDAHQTRRCIASGAGSLVAVQVLSKATRVGLISPMDPMLGRGLKDIMERCRPYSSIPGAWVIPSDQDGPPTSWNSAFALDAFGEVETLCLHLARAGVVDQLIRDRAASASSIWKRVTVLLSAVLMMVLLVPRLNVFAEVVAWFNAQSAWIQGITMAFVGIVIERLVALTTSVIHSMARARRKDR